MSTTSTTFLADLAEALEFEEAAFRDEDGFTVFIRHRDDDDAASSGDDTPRVPSEAEEPEDDAPRIIEPTPSLSHRRTSISLLDRKSTQQRKDAWRRSVGEQFWRFFSSAGYIAIVCDRDGVIGPCEARQILANQRRIPTSRVEHDDPALSYLIGKTIKELKEFIVSLFDDKIVEAMEEKCDSTAALDDFYGRSDFDTISPDCKYILYELGITQEFEAEVDPKKGADVHAHGDAEDDTDDDSLLSLDECAHKLLAMIREGSDMTAVSGRSMFSAPAVRPKKGKHRSEHTSLVFRPALKEAVTASVAAEPRRGRSYAGHISGGKKLSATSSAAILAGALRMPNISK